MYQNITGAVATYDYITICFRKINTPLSLHAHVFTDGGTEVVLNATLTGEFVNLGWSSHQLALEEKKPSDLEKEKKK